MQAEYDIRLASEEVRSNFHKTIILLCMMIVAIMGLSWLLGALLSDATLGFKIGFLVCLIAIPLEMMSARLMITSLTGCVPLDLTNPAEKRLLNIVEGLSVSAGLKSTPEVYLIETNIPNAFAAGWNEDSAFIGITTGLANMMDDQELEGVIAHEISHIVHRDIMICQMSIALNSAMLILAFITRWVSVVCAARTRDFFLRCIFLLIFVAIYPLSVLVGFLLCMAISRKREFAADALAVRLCSYNEGLIRALEKLENNCQAYNDEEINELGGKEVECLYFFFPAETLFSTHPTTQERIHRLKTMY